jgi:hypothetical protein
LECGGVGEASAAVIEERPGLQVLECEGEDVVSAHGDALGAGFLVAGVSKGFPSPRQIGGPYGESRPAAGN